MILIEPDHTLAYANEAALAMHGVAELSDLGAPGEVGIRKDGDCQEFRVGAAIVDPKEVPDGTTQSTPHP